MSVWYSLLDTCWRTRCIRSRCPGTVCCQCRVPSPARTVCLGCTSPDSSRPCRPSVPQRSGSCPCRTGGPRHTGRPRHSRPPPPDTAGCWRSRSSRHLPCTTSWGSPAPPPPPSASQRSRPGRDPPGRWYSPSDSCCWPPRRRRSCSPRTPPACPGSGRRRRGGRRPAWCPPLGTPSWSWTGWLWPCRGWSGPPRPRWPGPVRVRPAVCTSTPLICWYVTGLTDLPLVPPLGNTQRLWLQL